jgi:hypothetical protein
MLGRAALLALISMLGVASGEVDNLESRRALLLARVLSYDSSLAARAGNEVVLVVLFKRKNGPSERCAETVGTAFKQVENLRVVGARFRRVVAPYTSAGELEPLVERERAVALYLCAGLDGDLPAIKPITHRRKVLTIGTTEAQVRAGVSLVVTIDGGRMPIIVNWAESRDEGATFGTDLLRVARVIR